MSETEPAPGAPEGEGREFFPCCVHCPADYCDGTGHDDTCAFGCNDGPAAAPSPDPVRRELREAADEIRDHVAWMKERAQDSIDRARIVGAIEAAEMVERRSAALPAAPGIEGPGEGREDEPCCGNDSSDGVTFDHCTNCHRNVSVSVDECPCARAALSPRPTGEPDQPAHGRDEAGR